MNTFDAAEAERDLKRLSELEDDGYRSREWQMAVADYRKRTRADLAAALDHITELETEVERWKGISLGHTAEGISLAIEVKRLRAAREAAEKGAADAQR